MESIPLTKAKARFSSLVDRLIHLKGQIVITKRGKPVATMVPYEDWERLQAGAAGGLSGVAPPRDDLDAVIDSMVEDIYRARAKAKGRKPVI